MKEEEIRDILNSHQICFAQHGTLCATVKAGIGAYQNGLGEIMHTMKDHILHINAQGIAILAVDDINGAPQEHTLRFFRLRILYRLLSKSSCFIFFSR